jgi:hypothetical protein
VHHHAANDLMRVQALHVLPEGVVGCVPRLPPEARCQGAPSKQHTRVSQLFSQFVSHEQKMRMGSGRLLV